MANAETAEDVDLSVASVGYVTFIGAALDDLGLITLSAAKAIKQADLLIVDELEHADDLAQAGIEFTARVVVAEESEAPQLIAAVGEGHKVVRFYSSNLLSLNDVGATIAEVLSKHRVRTRVIPGMSRWESALIHGSVAPTASIAVLDAGRELLEADAWPRAETVMVWSTSQTHEAVAQRGAEVFGADSPVLRIVGVGTTSQKSDVVTWRTLEGDDEDICLVVSPSIDEPSRRQLDWFETKPLFDWSVLVPRTKDDLDEVVDALSRYGANSEIVATMSIEPPRTEQAMEKVVRGIVDGRYLWLIFTSPHAVEAIIERLAEFGLDSRALSGLSLAAVGRGTTEALGLHGLRPDLVPAGENTAAGLADEFPAYDDLMDPLDHVLIPSADVSVAPLLEGLERLGWQAEEVTAYRTVRAAPPPAEMRERIKDGQFDAVVFTSSSAVRNMIGIAGKPHSASVIAAIGPATATACEMHGLRVDVVADAPNMERLIEGLASFAEQRRADRLAQNLPDTKPSQRKRRRRRKSAS